MCGYLGGVATPNGEARQGKLLTIEEVGEIMKGEFEVLRLSTTNI